jgi:hypothetical protein
VLSDQVREQATGGRSERSCVLDSVGSGQKPMACCFEQINKCLAPIKKGNLFIEQQLAYKERFGFSHSGIYYDMI